MKAIVIKSHDLNDLALMDIPIPKINEDEILIRIKAVGVGIHDGYFLPKDMIFPYVIGIEAAGVVVQLGKNRHDYKLGDRVVFISTMQPKGGVWAEYAVLGKEALVMPIPYSLGYAQAATIPVAGGAAIKALRALDLNGGQTLFIAGASGAVGTLAIQLAVKKGIKVCASASPKNHEYMRSLGVEKTVDYADSNERDEIISWSKGGIDGAMAIQPKTSLTSMKMVKSYGKLISVSGDQVDPERNITVVDYPYNSAIKLDLMKIMNSVTSGEIKLYIDQVCNLDEALDVLSEKRLRHSRGKSVIVMDE